ncbi:AAA domain-containing protein [Pedobacter sp. SYSU D00535]|uniref:AAA domain-containing protein n=1 Tax=Pedobacter sp. SYSU D00535 TaxID=2810308 RepID=UPI001A9670C5|nr:AAA domain-containing protein [Pedobacter sp. SYSU D00535]
MEEYFKAQLDLLRQEREEDWKNYNSVIKTSTVFERRENGLCWYPLIIKGSELGRGDYLTVEFERTSKVDDFHQFKTGSPVALFSNSEANVKRLEGTVSYLNGNRIKVNFRTDELPDWSSKGKLGLDLLFDNGSYQEMEKALRAAESLATHHKVGSLVRILIGEDSPSFDAIPSTLPSSPLNDSQMDAFQKVLSARDIALVHGPPGTGKTTTIVQAIKAMVQFQNERVLVVAPSNAAVDLLSEKLSDVGLNVLRIGNPLRISDKLTALSLDGRMAVHPAMKEVKSLKRQAAEYKNMAHKYKRNFGRAEQEQRKALFNEARQILKEVDRVETFVVDDLVSKAQVITSTLVGANHFAVRDLEYNTVLIDEAAQALEPATWIPILKAKKVVLAGDHCQLPPTVKSEDAARNGLSITLFEKLSSLHPAAVCMLEQQYRMHSSIMGYSSQVFYGGRLKADPSVADHVLFAGDDPLVFLDTAGCGFEERQEGTSTTNPEEAALLVRHLQALVSMQHEDGRPPSIGIVSPYKQQVLLLKELIEDCFAGEQYGGKISVNSIDGFQGQERDVIYISMTRSNTSSAIGFLSDFRRMNVAMTRARKKLVVVGDSATLGRHPFYADFIGYVEKFGVYQSAWEFVG